MIRPNFGLSKYSAINYYIHIFINQSMNSLLSTKQKARTDSQTTSKNALNVMLKAKVVTQQEDSEKQKKLSSYCRLTEQKLSYNTKTQSKQNNTTAPLSNKNLKNDQGLEENLSIIVLTMNCL